MSLENTLEDLFSSEADKTWMQKESAREEKKGTTGSLRDYFKLKKDEKLTIEMLDKELDRLKKKYIKKDGDKYPLEIIAIIRKINMAKVYLKASEKRKKKNNKSSTEEDMEMFISEESLNYEDLDNETLGKVILNYFG